jgi:hypothetical protein
LVRDWAKRSAERIALDGGTTAKRHRSFPDLSWVNDQLGPAIDIRAGGCSGFKIQTVLIAHVADFGDQKPCPWNPSRAIV